MIKNGDLLRLFAAGVIIVLIVYAVVRGASFAYFRSRYEHFRRLLKAMREGEK
jgi:hypothetical protein